MTRISNSRPTLFDLGALAALAAVLTLATACSDDTTEPTPTVDMDAGTDAEMGDTDATGDAVDPDRGETDVDDRPDDPMRCYFEDREQPGCYPCGADHCGELLEAAYGVDSTPEQPGGACRDLLTCVEACACGDNDCLADCEARRSLDCTVAIDALDECLGAECLSVCGVFSVCGNEQIEVGEDCDGRAFPEDKSSCEALDYAGGDLGCSPNCFFDVSACEGEIETCGNGQVDPGEACEGDDTGGVFCTDLG